ncbi:ribosome silencing factor [Rubellicoccus peritrichatus]|uniref:Ribosomal silencing factor RsfS n=1 Tax=Rubellicoccus peritrichatus TaxID=3080537 RepID=A0AAQ3L8K4_9BACT|nr:ribosome silencing factor [Puniceicoccus sp. CR14]WOO41315.1 ribosome silencing factor [Puniceicoccus sp. CR14]
MTNSEVPNDTLLTIEHTVQALDEKQAIDISVLDIHQMSSITDYLVIATGNSQPHLKALKAAVEKSLKEDKVKQIGTDVSNDSGWVVIDAFDFMIHLFTLEMRSNYRLDQLWRDGEVVDIDAWIKSPVEK